MSDPAQHLRLVLQKYKQEEDVVFWTKGEHREFMFISRRLASPYSPLHTCPRKYKAQVATGFFKISDMQGWELNRIQIFQFHLSSYQFNSLSVFLSILFDSKQHISDITFVQNNNINIYTLVKSFKTPKFSQLFIAIQIVQVQ